MMLLNVGGGKRCQENREVKGNVLCPMHRWKQDKKLELIYVGTSPDAWNVEL